MFTIEMLAARYGDALWIEYGSKDPPNRVLIDGGTSPTIGPLTERISKIPEGGRHFDLMIVTHIDVDHIGGILNMLGDRSLGVTFEDVWFNGWRHLPDVAGAGTLGPIDGEIMSIFLDGLDHAEQPYRWNEAFGNGPAVVAPAGVPPSYPLPGGMRLTLLSPGIDQLINLKHDWTDVIRHQGWTEDQVQDVARSVAEKKGIRLDEPGGQATPETGDKDDQALGDTDPVERWAAERFIQDRAPANGSTIAVLAEYDGKAALLAGDGYPDVIQGSIDCLLEGRDLDRLRLDAYKLAHHGSKGNTSAELLRRLSCTKYLISTNGAKFHHPDPQAIARVLVEGGSGAQLHFNYATEETNLWNDRTWMTDHGYEAHYSTNPEGGLVVDLDQSS